MNPPQGADLQVRCERLRSLHTPGDPLLLPNVWDVATARAVVAAGFPVVATTSAGVARSLGYDDHEDAPAGEMIAAAWRIARNVDVPVTVDFEAGYGLAPADLVATLRDAGAAGCNLEETDHSTGGLRDPRERAAWLTTVREAASADRLPLGHQRAGRPVPRGFRHWCRPGHAGRPGARSARAGERLPRRRRRLRVPDRAVGARGAAPLHGGRGPGR